MDPAREHNGTWVGRKKETTLEGDRTGVDNLLQQEDENSHTRSKGRGTKMSIYIYTPSRILLESSNRHYYFARRRKKIQRAETWTVNNAGPERPPRIHRPPG